MSESEERHNVGQKEKTGHESLSPSSYLTVTDTPPSAITVGESSEARNDDLIGHILADKYRIHHLLGKGGAGAVYYATQLELDRPVALKVLRSDIICDLTAIERFRREARAAARLHHPNVVAVHDFGMLPEVCAYIAMEYLPGRNLREEIRRFPTGLSLPKAVSIFSQICAGVQSAHEVGIIHRDLKPQNILLEEGTAGTFRAKVLDFGIAKMLEGGEGVSDLTGSMLVGTPHYCSPEQCMGEPLDARSDIYSLAVVLFQMLTGHLPFDGATPSALVVQHVTAPPRNPREIRPEIPVGLERVILRSLEKNPNDRPSTALDFAALVEASLRPEAAFNTSTGEVPTVLTRPAKISGDTHQAPFLNTQVEQNEQPTLIQSLPFSDSNSGQQKVVEKKNHSGGVAFPLASKTSNFPTDISFGKRRLAVLPLRNVARLPDIDFLGFSLADAIIMQLAYIKSLIVRPSSAVERFRDQVDIPTIASSLEVDTILTGNFLRAGETFRVSVQLVDVVPNEILWREQFDLPFGDILALQDRIAEKVVEGLKLTISSSELELIRRDVPRDVEAYELYLRAKNCGHEVADAKTAIALLERSLQSDPNYAPAWAEMAHRHLYFAVQGLGGQSHIAEGEKAALQALALNPDLPEAHFMLMAAYAETGRVENALRTCYRLLEIAPNNELTHLGLGHVYEYTGMLDAALRAYSRSMQINPKLSSPYTQIAAVHCQRGDYNQAFEFLTNSECKEARCETRAYLLGLLALKKGKTEEAIKYFTFSEQLSPKSLWGRLSLAMRLRAVGSLDASFVLLDQIRETTTSGDACFYLAHHFVTADRQGTALDLLEQSVDLGYCNVEGFRDDPAFELIRQTERFQGLMERARLKKRGFMTCMEGLQRLESPQNSDQTV